MVHNLFQQFNLNLGFTGKYFLHNQNKKLFFIVCYIKCYMQIPSFGSSLQHNIIILTVSMFLGNLSLSQLALLTYICQYCFQQYVTLLSIFTQQYFFLLTKTIFIYHSDGVCMFIVFK